MFTVRGRLSAALIVTLFIALAAIMPGAAQAEKSEPGSFSFSLSATTGCLFGASHEIVYDTDVSSS